MILCEVYYIIYFKIKIFVYNYKLFVRVEVNYIYIIFIFIIFSIVKLCESTKDSFTDNNDNYSLERGKTEGAL